ncbi:helix-turn-helix domain-containing protein [Paeniglutamicibacter cryotolerans]|uniref:helix-turn-helix domain-containing protein n=1 Tax=Paeniglutamicibacter cryotolerans TaxID=670079 RepID=UPI0038995005
MHPHYSGGRPAKFTDAQREQIKRIALDHPGDHDLPFSTWSLSKLADYLVQKEVVEDISPEGLRMLLRQQNVSLSHPSKPGRAAPTRTTKRRRPVSCTSMTSPTARPTLGKTTRTWPSATTNSDR